MNSLFRDTVGALDTLSLQSPTALHQLKDQFHAFLRAETFLYYSVHATLDGVRLKTIGGASDDSKKEALGKHVFDFPDRFKGLWPGFDPIHVAPALRNRVSTYRKPERFNPWAKQDAVFAKIAPEFRLGGYDQLRVLVCDGPTSLYWVGAARPEPFTDEDVKRLERMVPALRKRLRLERSVEGAHSLSLLVGILNGFTRAAFLINGRGHIEAANDLGVALWDQDRDSVKRALAERTDRFELSSIKSGQQQYVLALERRSVASTQERATAAARRWTLTPRQGEVLTLLCDGLTNWQIASRLHCTERTVEVHVSAILLRAQAANRATLVAEVLRLDC